MSNSNVLVSVVHSGWNHLGDGPLGMSVGNYIHYLNLPGKTLRSLSEAGTDSVRGSVMEQSACTISGY